MGVRDYYRPGSPIFDAINDLLALAGELDREVAESIAARDADDSQANRRRLVRAMFAEIEGVCYRLNQIGASLAGLHPDMFSAGELALIREESYELDDQGRVRTRTANTPFLANLQFPSPATAVAGKRCAAR